MSEENTPEINLEALKNFIPFDSLTDSHLKEIRSKIQVQAYSPTKVVFKRGSQSRLAYFLISGAVDLADANFEVRHFAADDDENYLALDNYPEHTVSAITTEPSVIYALERDHLDLLMTWSQAAESMLDEENTDEHAGDWMDSLLESGLFAQVPPAKIQALFSKFDEQKVQLGEKVITQGDDGDTFYVIKEGKAMVTRKEGSREETLAALTAGDFFGEDALISNTPRNATITMTSDGILMALGKEDFTDILHASVIHKVTVDQLEEMSDEGACVLIDVRLPMEFKHDRTASARNIPLPELRRSLQGLEKDFSYVVCCDGGRRSELGAYILSEAGFTAYVLDRGDATPSHAKDSATADESDNG